MFILRSCLFNNKTIRECEMVSMIVIQTLFFSEMSHEQTQLHNPVKPIPIDSELCNYNVKDLRGSTNCFLNLSKTHSFASIADVKRL